MTNYEKIISTGICTFAELFSIPTDIDGMAKYISSRILDLCVTCPFNHVYCKCKEEDLCCGDCARVVRKWLDDEYGVDKILAMINSESEED